MKTAKLLDWISASQMPNEYGEVVRIIPEWLQVGEEIKPLPRFEKSYALKPAGVYALCASGTKCKFIELTGSQLAEVREKTGVLDGEIVQHFTSTCQNITRIDYAVDMFEADFSPFDILALWEGKKIKSRIRTVRTYKTHTGYGGETLYFGSKKSPTQIRIYDKAAEQKLLQEAWIRVELQCRKKTATPLANDMARHGVIACGDQKLRDLITMPENHQIPQAIAGQETDLTTIPRKQPAWRDWMEGQVLQSIKNHVSTPDEREWLNGWLDKVADIIVNGYIKQST